MFLPSHLYTGYGSDQKVPAPTKKYRLRPKSTGSATLVLRLFCFVKQIFYRVGEKCA